MTENKIKIKKTKTHGEFEKILESTQTNNQTV